MIGIFFGIRRDYPKENPSPDACNIRKIRSDMLSKEANISGVYKLTRLIKISQYWRNSSNILRTNIDCVLATRTDWAQKTP